jgi:hypothetical protein
VLISATAFTVVGNACKIATVCINLLIWDKHANATGPCSIDRIEHAPNRPNRAIGARARRTAHRSRAVVPAASSANNPPCTFPSCWRTRQAFYNRRRCLVLAPRAPRVVSRACCATGITCLILCLGSAYFYKQAPLRSAKSSKSIEPV